MRDGLQQEKPYKKAGRRRAVFCLLGMLLLLLAGCGGNMDSAMPPQTDGQTAVFSAGMEAADAEPASPADTGLSADAQSEAGTETAPDENGSYTTKEDVALYLHTYGKLPSNFITKKEAQRLGWQGGSLEAYAPGKCIGGDRFGNYEGALPDGAYHECDIDTQGASGRGAKRIVYSDDGRIYYTEDHYETFARLY